MTAITLPLSEDQAVAVVVAADAFGVEPWVMAVHALQAKRWFGEQLTVEIAEGSP